MRKTASILIVIPAVVLAFQEPSEELKARSLFYSEQGDNDQLPRGEAARKAVLAPPAAKPKPAAKPARSAPSETRVEKLPAPPIPEIPVVQHLGFRYNVLLVDGDKGAAELVDADRAFKNGECFALEFEPNRSGYLYIFGRGSSGAWKPLFPSAEMPEESNIVRSRTRVRVPVNYCFEIGPPPGVERLFVVLSRDLEDFHDLNQAIRSQEREPATQPTPEPNRVVMASVSLDQQIARMQQSLQSRDLAVKKIARPVSTGEPAHSVYVVNASDTPASRIVTEVRIQHP